MRIKFKLISFDATKALEKASIPDSATVLNELETYNLRNVMYRDQVFDDLRLMGLPIATPLFSLFLKRGQLVDLIRDLVVIDDKQEGYLPSTTREEVSPVAAVGPQTYELRELVGDSSYFSRVKTIDQLASAYVRKYPKGKAIYLTLIAAGLPGTLIWSLWGGITWGGILSTVFGGGILGIISFYIAGMILGGQIATKAQNLSGDLYLIYANLGQEEKEQLVDRITGLHPGVANYLQKNYLD
ncbi:MAG: hypothetical protein HQ564_09285 [Candidatus Saganbacteria bacterium]|nr:hypothetical protein [Candidatus Saganbacteria bacterium]